MEVGYCTECDEPTGNAGRGDGSLFIDIDEGKDGIKEIGPLCDDCYDKQC